MTTLKGKQRHTGKRVSEAEFRRMWADQTLSQAEIGRRLGISGSAVRSRAATRGLPPRPDDRHFARQFDHERIVRLYLAGFSAESVSARIGCSLSVVRHAVIRAGHKMRSRNMAGRPKVDDILRAAMAASAREEQAALRLAEMVDGVRDPNNTGRRAA